MKGDRWHWKAWSLVFLLAFLPLLAGLTNPQGALAGTCPHPPEGDGPPGVDLDECVSTTHFIVYYTTDAADSPHDIDSEAEAQLVADNLEYAWDRYVNDPDFDLPIPLNTGVEPLEVWIWNCSGLGSTSPSDNHMNINAGFVRASDTSEGQRLQAEATPLHELLHRVQFKYSGFYDEYYYSGLFAIEGHTKFMEDGVFADLDAAAGTQYMLRACGYLGNPNWNVITASYNACLFWKYFSEQYGAATDEPERGVDIIRHFWEASNTAGAVADATVNLTLDSLGYPSVTFKDVFSDWIVANYTKDLATVPDGSYAYIDDDDNPYCSVPMTYNAAVGAGDYTTRNNQSVQRWGARYYRIAPNSTCNAANFAFHRDSGQSVYHVFTVDGGELVDHWSSTAADYSKTVINDGYDEMVAVVGGYGAATQVDVSYGCADLSLEIDTPTNTDKAFVGSILDPDKFLVRLAVTSPQNIEIAGLQAQDFDITVGTQAADIILGAYVQSQYWLLVQAPTQAAAGEYDLTAAYGPASDTKPTAVKYITIVHDDMLVIDRTGSMLTNDKIGAAKNAATLYVDATGDGNKLGLVSFASPTCTDPPDDATLDYSLTDVNSEVRSAINTLISDLEANGCTSLGDGLWVALQDIDDHHDVEHPCTMVLLSDGNENTARYWSDVQADVLDSPCVVDTIALGPDTNEVLLQEIAGLTGGNYYYVPDEDFTQQSTLQATGPWPYELASTYEYIEGDVAGRTRLLEAHGEVEYNDYYTRTITIEDDVTEAVFFADLDSHVPSVWILDPDGVRIACDDPGVRCEFDPTYHHAMYHVQHPTLQPGDWTLVIGFYVSGSETGSEQAPQQTIYDFVVGASANSHRTLDVFLGAPLASRLTGVQMPILAALTSNRPILGAELMAIVIGPDGAEHLLPLVDDGQHGDGNAGDGLYGNLFTLATKWELREGVPDGSYRVKVLTDGVPGEVGARYAQTGFAIELDADTDGDGMPDNWEDIQGLDKLDPSDAGEDPDLDALDNLAEYNNGTNPHDSDSDAGGENDGSEVDLFGQDPLDPADDEIPAIPSVSAAPNIASVVLTYGVDPDYNRLRLARSLDTDSGFLWVQNNVDLTGVYTDTGLTNGTPYFYRMMAVDDQGHRSAVSPSVSATPKEDPFPPAQIAVLINDGADQTTSRAVTLTLSYEEPGPHQDATEVLLANEPTFADAGDWQAFDVGTPVPWTLAAGLQSGDIASVYAKFRDAAENESPDVAGDSIEYVGTPVYLPVVLRDF